jgi:hypothetical protein
MRKRKRIRLAYACDCAGDKQPGRPHYDDDTRAIRGVVYEWTGEPQQSCPWRSLRDPFVRRVVDAYPWFESGQIGTAFPGASHRFIEGLGYYHARLGLCHSKHMELEREAAQKR